MLSRRLFLSVLVALLLMPAVASAAPDWAPSVAFQVPGNAYGGQDEVRYQNGGVATEAFLEVQSITPLQTTLHVGTLPPGGSYADQLTIPSSPGAIPTGAQIAVAPNGAAVAAWAELIGPALETSPYRYRAAYRPAGGTWEAPTIVAADSERNKEIYEYLVPVIGSDGTAAVGIQHIASGDPPKGQNEPRYRLDVAVHPAGGGWGAPARISSESESGESLALSLDGQGDLTAAYTLRFSEGGTTNANDDRSTVIVRRRPASSGVWGPSENITGSEIQWTADALHLGENDAGDAVVAYQYVRSAPQTLDVWAVTRQGPNGSWTTPVHAVEGSSAPADANVAPNGMAYVLYWFQGTSSAESCEGVLRAPAGGAFSAQRCVSPTNEDTFSGSIAFLGSDALFAWTGNVPGESSNGSIQGARWPDSSSLPEVARDLDLPGLPYGSPTLMNDDQGSVVALYTNQANQLRAAAFDGGPPILLSAGVPAGATVGQVVPFSSAFTDLWAGLATGQPTWSFGDGTPPASGGSVTHSFSAPGTYTVTLTASDARGNTTSSSYPITVQAGAVSPSDAKPPAVTLSMPACSRKMSKKACKRRRASHSAWQTLTGQVTDPSPSSGIASVQIAIYLTKGKHIEGLTGGHFRKTTKTKARKAFAAAKLNGSHSSLKLPKLKAGRYTVLVRATDRAGHVSAVLSKTLQLT